MKSVTQSITLRSERHYGRRVPPRAFGEILCTIPRLLRQSVRMSFEGRSTVRGKLPRWLARASDVRFVDHEGDCDTTIFFEIPQLGEAAPEIYAQREFWPNRPEPNDTAFDLLADVVSDISASRSNSERFDPPLLKRIQRLGSVLDSAFQECLISGRRYPSSRPAIVNRAVIENADTLTRATPPSRQARVAGELDMIRASTNTVAIHLQDGQEVRGVLTHGHVADLQALLQQKVVLMGKAVYRPSGSLLRIDVAEVRPMSEADEFFQTLPEPLPESFNKRDVRMQGGKKGVRAIVGKWPGDETEQQVQAALQRIS